VPAFVIWHLSGKKVVCCGYSDIWSVELKAHCHSASTSGMQIGDDVSIGA
jgi:hypothetical protein